MSGRTIKTVQLKRIHREGGGPVTEREDVHKKAFTKWLNSHLSKANPPIRVVDLISDLSDGNVWLSLFDVLLKTKTERESGRSHLHNMYNLQKALQICQKNEIKIEGINASDIAEGNSKTILGLLWNIIVHFQMKGTLKVDSKDYSIEKNLQSWCLTQLHRYKEFVQVKDFTTSWRDGKAFNAVLHSYKPDLFDFSQIMTMDNVSRLEHAFTMASLEWNVPRLLEPVDVDIEKPDKKMITMYLTCLYERLESPDNSCDIGVRQSHHEASSSSSVSRQYVTKKSIRLSSVSSDISSASSSAEHLALSPTSTSLEIPDEVVETVSTALDAPPTDTDLPRRVKHSEMYKLSSISSDEDTSPLMSRRFKGDADSDSTTSTDTVIHVETAATGRTTTTTTTTTRRVQLRGGIQGDGDGGGETTTTTVIREMHLVQIPGETSKKTTYGSGTDEHQTAEDKLSSECESILETTEGLDKSFAVKEDQSEIIEDKLTEAAIALSDLEPRVKMRGSGEDVKKLIKERDQLQFKVNQILLTGRKMVLDRVLDNDKESVLIEKLDKLDRRLKLLMLWPIRDMRSVSNYDKLLDDKLKVVEAAVFYLEPKVKKSVITRDIKELAKECEDLELKAAMVVDLGRDLIRDKQIEQDKERGFSKRMEQLETKIQLIMMWPIKELNKLAFSSTSNYSTYLKHKFDDAESAVSHMEPRIKKSYMNDDNTNLIQERKKVHLIVQGTTGLGRSMIEHRLLDRKEKKDFSLRIEKFEQSTNLLMAWPIRENKRIAHDKFLQIKLEEVESAFENIEPRIENADVFRYNTDLIEERDNLHLQTQAVVSLGRGLSDDKLLDRSKEVSVLNRIERLEKRMNAMMDKPLDEKSSNFNHNNYLEKKIRDMDASVTDMEQRLRESFRNKENKDNKALIKERQDLDVQVHGVVTLGRGMIHDKKIDQGKENDLTIKLDRLENKAKVMMKWPIRGSSSSGDCDKFLDEMLAEADSALTHFEPRIRRKKLNADEIKNLDAEREDLERKVNGVVNLGRTMIEDKLIDKKKEKHYQQRINDVERKMKTLMNWPILKLSGNEDYDEYFEEKLKKVETSVADMEPRIRKSSNNKDNKELLKEREDLDVQVSDTVSLGRAMMDDSCFSSKKEQEFTQTIKKLEEKMKMLMMWPIKGTGSIFSALLGSSDHDKVLDEKLKEVSSEVTIFEPSLRNTNLSAAEIKDLNSERVDLETKVNGVVNLGRAMIEDKLIDKKKEKHYQQRLDDIDGKMKTLMNWPIKKLRGNEDYDKYFEEKLKKVETSVVNMEPRIRKSGNNKDNKELLKERKDLDVQVSDTVSLGRAMIEDSLFSSNKQQEFKQRMEKLEQKMNMLMMWPIQGTGSVLSALLGSSDHDKFLDDKLNEVANEVNNFEPRLRKKNLSAAEIKDLHSERDDLETKVCGVVNLGRAMIEDKLIDKKKEKHYQQRIDDIDGKMKTLMNWPIKKLSGNEDYDEYFEEKLKKVETSAADMESRIRKSGNNNDNKEVLKEREDLDVQVSDTVRLGRAMMEDSLFSSIKKQEFKQRMEKLEEKMKMLMMWPIKETGSAALGPSDHDRFLDEKLNEVASEMTNFEPRLRKKNLIAVEIKDLHSERDDLETKVCGVVNLGRAMIEDKLIDKKKEKHYQRRIDDVEQKMKMLMNWPIKKLSGNEDYDKYFEEKLKKVETSVVSMEPRIRKSGNNKENKELMKELKDLDVQVSDTVGLGRAMMEDSLFSSNKDQEFQQRMEELEDKMKLMWQIGDKNRKPKSKRTKTFDDNLRQMEITVSEFEERAKVKDRESVDLKSAKEGLDDIKEFVAERDQIELEAFGLLNEGRTIVEEEELDPLDRDYYERRMDRLEERVRVLREWLQKELQRLFDIYIILIKQHLERLDDWLIRAEARIDYEDDIAPTSGGVTKQYDDHQEFHKEVGAYSTTNMILDMDMDDPVLDDDLRQYIKNMSERWAAVWNWSEDRKKRLADVIVEWEKFREEERRLFDWLCDKEDAMRLIETTDISDADEVECHQNLLQSLIQEMEAQEDRLHIFQETGEILIANAQYHNETAKPLRDEMNDFEECWKAILGRAERRQSELKDSRQKFVEMAELKKEIQDWLIEAETLMSTGNAERDESEEEKYLEKIRVKCQERDTQQRHMDHINTLTQELRPAIEHDSAQDINHVVKPLNRRWQDTSDKLDQCRDRETPLLQDECCLVAYIKNTWTANKKAQEVHFQ